MVLFGERGRLARRVRRLAGRSLPARTRPDSVFGETPNTARGTHAVPMRAGPGCFRAFRVVRGSFRIWQPTRSGES
jgi:hypothetical protein